MLIYSLILHLRHFFYDKGWKKSYPTEIPSVCVGNISAGGTGKTPMTELIINTLLEGNVPSADAELYGFDSDSLFSFREEKEEVAVVSLGYRRKTKGFQQVTSDGTAKQFGDEPLQIKKKFPQVTVVVDKDRVRACDLLAHPSKIKEFKPRKLRRIVNPDFHKPDVIILDDAFQDRRIRATRNIVLTTYSRPYFRDALLPLGMLRDLRSRARHADMLIVTKCPTYITDKEREKYAKRLKLKNYDQSACEGVNRFGKRQKLLFAATAYDGLLPVFPEGDVRYTHSKAAILFSGIADDTQLLQKLNETYKVVAHHKFPDHHFYSAKDIERVSYSSYRNPIAVIVTTEKDAQRLADIRLKINEDLRRRLFFAPIHTQMVTAAEQDCLRDFVKFHD